MLLCLFTGAALLAACNKDDNGENHDTGYLHGAYIVNEGAYGNSNSSISYFDTDSSIVVNHVFEAANGRPLGDVAQSFTVVGEKGVIVVNNSQKIEVVDLKTFVSVGTISGFDYPRYFLAINNHKGYLSNGNYGGCVYVIDLDALKVTDTIPCGSGPERMVRYGNNVFVANAGGWGNDSTLTVIDTDKDAVKATWQVGMNPVDMVLDKDQQLWVLCKGKVVWNMDFTIGEETPSTLVAIDPVSGTVEQTSQIGTVGDYYWPQHIGINKNLDQILYLEAAGVHIRNIANGSECKSLIAKNIYGFGVDPSSNLIYALASPSFTTAGWLLRYSQDGSLKDSVEVGIGPSQIVFN